MIDGNYHQILNQVVGVVIAIVLAVVGTYVILKIVDCRDRRARVGRA